MNLLDRVSKRTSANVSTSRSTFNTNDFILKVLLDKSYSRKDTIDLIIVERMKLAGINIEKMTDKEFDAVLSKYQKTSKNGLDTSVSDSNNNSSFSYNDKYANYKLIKTGGMLTIKAIKK